MDTELRLAMGCLKVVTVGGKWRRQSGSSSWVFCLLCLAAPWASAFTCYPEYQFSWCDNSTEASCVHNYAFSVGNFQRKIRDYYLQNKRPPLTEAYFLTKLPKPFQLQFPESGCAAPLIMGYLLVAEARLPIDDDAEQYASVAQSLLDQMSEAMQPILADSRAWPFAEAIERYSRTAADVQVLRRRQAAALPGGLHDLRPDLGYVAPVFASKALLEVVVVHCREDLAWVDEKLLPIAPPRTVLTFYEKCGEQPMFSAAVTERFGSISVRPCRDPVDRPRGDECLGYLAHLVGHYAELATFTVFLQADPHEHMHFVFLDSVFKMIARGTYLVAYLPLNGARHVRTITPCMNAVHEAIFGQPISEPVGPYCCAQFVVQDVTIRARPLSFYQNMLRLVDGSVDYDLCTSGRVTRSTHCYGMEFMWHLVFGEGYEPPLRQDDSRLPTPLRLKFGDDHVRRDWNAVVLNPNTPKKIVEQVNYDQVIR